MVNERCNGQRTLFAGQQIDGHSCNVCPVFESVGVAVELNIDCLHQALTVRLIARCLFIQSIERIGDTADDAFCPA